MERAKTDCEVAIRLEPRDPALQRLRTRVLRKLGEEAR